MEFRPRIAGWGAAGVVFAATLVGWAQYSPTNNGPVIQNSPNTHRDFGGGLETDPVFVEKRLRALNQDRHKSLVSDTDKLVKLARQLDAEVASNPSNELTPAQLRKVAEIEKLAHNVKAKMAQSFEGGPQFYPSPIRVGGPDR